MLLAARVSDEEVDPAVAVPVDGADAHARVRVGYALRRRPFLEPEAELRRVGLPASRPRHVHVEAIGIRVVRDVEIGAAVAVVVREDGPEAVVEPRHLEPRLPADLAEPRAAASIVALVEVETVAHAHVVAGEA